MFFLLIESHGKSLLDSRYVHCAFIAKSDHWVWRTMIEGGCVSTVPAEIPHPPPPVAVPSANLVPRSPEIANIIANPCSSAHFCTVRVWRCKYLDTHLMCAKFSVGGQERRNIKCIFGPHFFCKITTTLRVQLFEMTYQVSGPWDQTTLNALQLATCVSLL